MDSTNTLADAEALCGRAADLIAAGRLGAARPILAAAKALSADTPQIKLLSARLASADGDWARAIEELDQGIATSPAHTGLRKYRAEARHRSGDIEGAARDAAEAVMLDRDDSRSKALLGAALLDLGRTVDAVSCLRDAIHGAPKEVIYREVLAIALERGGDRDTAFEVLNEAIALAPARVATRNAAILFSIRRRDFTAAARLAETARQDGVADATTFGMKGHALSSLGRHDEAASAYQDALKLDPEDTYVRHLVAASGAIPDSNRAPEHFVRTIFDGYADRFEAHLIALGYGIPGVMRAILERHPKIIAGQPLGPVLDLGCGTGLAALAIGDLPLGPFTGVDLSPRMLDHARVKRLYTELREADIVADLTGRGERWPLIVAADVVCYFGALDDLFAAVHQALEPSGWFLFSTEEILPDHDGVMPGNGNWALGRQGRYSHASHYVYEAACAAGFRVLRMDRPPIRQEAGADVPGLMLTLERMVAS